jgi:aspartate-semialdehyde dehydrogenase
VAFEKDLRIAVLGASGLLGKELLQVLETERFPVKELIALGSESSMGDGVWFNNDEVDVVNSVPVLSDLDLIFLCAPQEVSLALTREALQAGVPCVDLSGAVSGSSEVPLLYSGIEVSQDALHSPLMATPGGPALVWAPILSVLRERLGLRRASGTLLESAGGEGRKGVAALSGESLALFNQSDLPDPDLFGRALAFDCLSGEAGEADDSASTSSEVRLMNELNRLLGKEAGDPLPISVTAVRVPTFAGQGSSLAVELAPGTSLEDLRKVLSDAPGLSLYADEDEASAGPGPSLRDAAGREDVLLGRIRPDTSAEGSFLLWAVGDPIRLAAVNAVELAMERFLRE